MDVPKGFAKENIEEILKKLLKDDKVNVIIIKEGRTWIAQKCMVDEEGIILEFDENGNPSRILGCSNYNEKTGECGYNKDSCNYLKWKKLKPYKGED